MRLGDGDGNDENDSDDDEVQGERLMKEVTTGMQMTDYYFQSTDCGDGEIPTSREKMMKTLKENPWSHKDNTDGVLSLLMYW